MVLVDTSVWITHLRKGHDRLRVLLEEADIAVHPMIIGELACGALNPRREILGLLESLPSAVVAEHQEVIALIEKRRLWGYGIGYVDVHLLTSAILSNISIWTEDNNLRNAATMLHVAYQPAGR